MLRFALVFVFVFISALPVFADGVVAVVGNKTISLEEFNKRYDDVRRQTINPPSKKAFLEDLVRYEMGVQEAEKRNLSRDPIIAERMRQELYKGLIEKDLSDKISAISINEEQMRDYYKSSPELRTSHILIEVKVGATPAERAAAKTRADEIYSEVKKSKRPFEEMVKLYTDDLTTKKQGGDVGYQSRVTVVPSYYEAAVRLKVGEVTGVVETPYGFHVIKLTGKHSYEEANKKQIRAAIFEKKRLALFNEYFDKVKRHYKVTLNLDNIK